MELVELLRANLLSPVILAFFLGVVATLVRSDLKFPEGLFVTLSIYLLLAIGLKGGAELAKTTVGVVWRPSLATLLLGVVTPLTGFAVLRSLGGFSVVDSAALAAHYGSVSAVTFIASLSFLHAMGVETESFLPALVALLEIPAIVVALLLAQVRAGGPRRWPEALREILAGRSIVLLVGGLAIGLACGKGGLARVAPFFIEPFQGALMLFLLEMGMVAARRLRDLQQTGVFLAGFAILMPVAHGVAGVLLGKMSGLSLGGTVVMGVLAGSASYIAAPAAVRVALPEANPGYYLTASLGITFPFNLTVGIPLYYAMAQLLHGT